MNRFILLSHFTTHLFFIIEGQINARPSLPLVLDKNKTLKNNKITQHRRYVIVFIVLQWCWKHINLNLNMIDKMMDNMLN